MMMMMMMKLMVSEKSCKSKSESERVRENLYDFMCTLLFTFNYSKHVRKIERKSMCA